MVLEEAKSSGGMSGCGRLVAGFGLLVRRRGTSGVGAQHHAIETKQTKDRQRLIAQPLDDDASALCPDALVERDQRADSRAVDHTERRQIDLHDGRPALDQLLEIGAQL